MQIQESNLREAYEELSDPEGEMTAETFLMMSEIDGPDGFGGILNSMEDGDTARDLINTAVLRRSEKSERNRLEEDQKSRPYRRIIREADALIIGEGDELTAEDLLADVKTLVERDEIGSLAAGELSEKVVRAYASEYVDSSKLFADRVFSDKKRYPTSVRDLVTEGYVKVGELARDLVDAGMPSEEVGFVVENYEEFVDSTFKNPQFKTKNLEGEDLTEKQFEMLNNDTINWISTMRDAVLFSIENNVSLESIFDPYMSGDIGNE
jgi:hypothetical protein